MIKINGLDLPIKTFPNGEVLINIEDVVCAIDAISNVSSTSNEIYVEFSWKNDADLLHLKFVSDYFRSKKYRVNIRINYMPYSRMDRQTSALFTLRSACDFINSLDFDSVVVAEPHSDVTCALLDNATAWNLTSELFGKVAGFWNEQTYLPKFDVGQDVLVFPDAGAQKRYSELSVLPHLVGFKHRNTSGEITSLELVSTGDGALQNKSRAFILDDLCSFGGTFVRVCEKLSDQFDEIYLIVAHLEESVYQGELLTTLTDGYKYLDGIFASNSLQDKSKDPAVHLYNLQTERWINDN